MFGDLKLTSTGLGHRENHRRGSVGVQVIKVLLIILATGMATVTKQSQAIGRTWHIANDGSGDAPTIQAGVDSAGAGDTVLVGQGTYVENINNLGKTIYFLSENGPEATILDGGSLGSVIWISDGNVHIEGFTIQNGLNDFGGGVRIVGVPPSPGTVTIKNNIIRNNVAGRSFDEGLGGGLIIYWCSDCLIEQNTFINNFAGDSGGGLSLGGTNTIVRNNTISSNGCHVGGGGILSNPESQIIDNLILENWSDSFGGGIRGDAALIRNNTIVGNYINNSVSSLGAGLEIYRMFGNLSIERNIIVKNHGPIGAHTGIGLDCDTGSGTISLECNDVWGNDSDFQLTGQCDTTGLSNLSLNPLFCDEALRDFRISTSSPCAPGQSSICGLIGAFEPLCEIVPTLRKTWGELKRIYVPVKRGQVSK